VSVAALVLAGGASTRFGADKLAADLDGRPVLAHAIAAVRGITNPVVVVLAPDVPIPRAAEGCLVVRDTEEHGGPLAGLAAGLDAVVALPAPAPEIAVVVGGDMPSLVPDVLELLAGTLAADTELVAVTLEADPPSALPMAVRPALALLAAQLLLASERRRLRGLLEVVPSAVVPAAEWRRLDRAGSTLRDVDLPEDLAPS
jgi:molybdopterin-guanine dinucleotide biosynthesis protein A